MAEALATYRAKRDFRRTPEPSGADGAGDVGPPRRRFVVQRHRARRLHYDVRLEIDGVLVSWAVPKGPTLDPRARRLAVHVEDHPIEYIDFEGVIPAGEYGGGDVIVWDRGTWAPHATDDPAAAVAAGELHVDLDGEKLGGRFVFVRRDERDWMLVHKRDDHAVDGWDPEEHPRSVLSGRTNEEVAAAPRATWRSGAAAHEAALRLGDPPRAATGGQSWTTPSAEELAALDDLGREGRWAVDGVEVRLTNLDKVLAPAVDAHASVTKRDLVRYVSSCAPVSLAYLAGRPVNVRRAPNGVDGQAFWQKAVPSHAPDWVTRWRNDAADPGETEMYVVADRVATLVWLANEGGIELHPWTSTAAAPDHPSWALIDIDPGSAADFDDVLVLARLYRAALDHLGVDARPKTTGKRGIQIWIPIAQGPSFDETRRWVETVSRAVGATVPEMVSWRWRVDEREGRTRLDFTQNAINKTLVAPYSPRLVPGAAVSVPLEWDELDHPALRPDRWDVHTVPDRLARVGDPFGALLDVAQDLPAL